MKRPIFPAILVLCTLASLASAQARHRAPEPAFQVHITPTTVSDSLSSIDIDAGHWNAHGFDLKSLIAEIYNIDPRLIELPESAAAARYDVSLNFPEDSSQQDVDRLLQQALQARFKITITPQPRSMEVYVITAPNGPGPALHPHAQSSRRTAAADVPSQITYQGQMCPGVFSGGISASAGSISEFRRTLEPNLDRLLVDESHLAGSYDFNITKYTSREELFHLLSEQLGLKIVPSQRVVTVLAVHTA